MWSTLKRLIGMAILALVLLSPGITAPALAAPHGGNCRTWFMDATVTSLLHAGCRERPSGLWQAAPGRCAKVARRGYRLGLRGAEVNAYAARWSCMYGWNGWEGVAFTTADEAGK